MEENQPAPHSILDLPLGDTLADPKCPPPGGSELWTHMSTPPPNFPSSLNPHTENFLLNPWRPPQTHRSHIIGLLTLAPHPDPSANPATPCPTAVTISTDCSLRPIWTPPVCSP